MVEFRLRLIEDVEESELPPKVSNQIGDEFFRLQRFLVLHFKNPYLPQGANFQRFYLK